jgi:predicted nucleic acid-binding protein
VIYCDSSALLRLIFLERETADLRRWLVDRPGNPVISSVLAKVEVLRGCRRINVGALPQAHALLADIQLIPLSGSVIDEASGLADPQLRSLDALHLSSALSIGLVLTAFIAYDRRLAAAADAAGLTTIQPGA